MQAFKYSIFYFLILCYFVKPFLFTILIPDHPQDQYTSNFLWVTTVELIITLFPEENLPDSFEISTVM